MLRLIGQTDEAVFRNSVSDATCVASTPVIPVLVMVRCTSFVVLSAAFTTNESRYDNNPISFACYVLYSSTVVTCTEMFLLAFEIVRHHRLPERTSGRAETFGDNNRQRQLDTSKMTSTSTDFSPKTRKVSNKRLKKAEVYSVSDQCSGNLPSSH